MTLDRNGTDRIPDLVGPLRTGGRTTIGVATKPE